MKKALFIANIITISILFLFVFGRNKHLSFFSEAEKTKPADSLSPACLYDLKDFDFHFKAECDSPKIIMLGNSLIRQGDWIKLLNRNDVVNRGIAGNNIKCICERLQYIKGKKAKIWFIEGGINDLPFTKPSVIFNSYVSTIQFIKNENAIPVITWFTYHPKRLKNILTELIIK